MTWGMVAVGGTSLIGGLISGEQQARAQEAANRANVALTQEQIAEMARQFDIGTEERALDKARASEMSESRRAREDEINRQLQDRFGQLRSENLARLDPYSQAGEMALGEYQALLGLGGREAQEAAMSRFSESPGQKFLRERQEKALVANAAALGGLGGGNVRTALQEQAYNIAQQDYENQLSRLAGLSSQGLTAAQGGLQAGYGPSYVQTGQDIGVATQTPTGPQMTSYQPADISTGSGSGGGLSGALSGLGDLAKLGIGAGGAAMGLGGGAAAAGLGAVEPIKRLVGGWF